jgi:threonine/homoserine/homoserine lactone efflux protein
MHPLLVFAALNLAAAISPGPAFVLVIRTAAAGTAGRTSGQMDSASPWEPLLLQ